MKFRCLGPVGAVFALAAVLRAGSLPHITRDSPPGPACVQGPVGYLVIPAPDSSDGSGRRLEPYYPKAGDILLYDEHNKLFHFCYKLAGTGPPTHAAMIYEQCDGKPVVLDLTGPTVIKAKVVNLEVGPRLNSFQGTILVRRLRQPLDAEQKAALCNFAEAQVGKDFAVKRIMLQGTPFRARCGLRARCFGRTCLERKRWICSEIVVAAATVAHILDPHVFHANAMYPRDLAYDEHYDLSGTYHEALMWVSDPSAVSHSP